MYRYIGNIVGYNLEPIGIVAFDEDSMKCMPVDMTRAQMAAQQGLFRNMTVKSGRVSCTDMPSYAVPNFAPNLVYQGDTVCLYILARSHKTNSFVYLSSDLNVYVDKEPVLFTKIKKFRAKLSNAKIATNALGDTNLIPSKGSFADLTTLNAMFVNQLQVGA